MAEVDVPTKRFERMANDLFAHGWSVERDFLNPEQRGALASDVRVAWEAGAFRQAGIGSGDSLQLDSSIRRDHVLWLHEAELSPAQRVYYAQLEALRRDLNQAMQLGLFSFEGHFAVYGTGGFYAKHLDQFQAGGRRRISTVLYLNADWQPSDGGRLRLYLDGPEAGSHRDIEPRDGTLVSFLSDRFYHEVLPALRQRVTLSGWFLARE